MDENWRWVLRDLERAQLLRRKQRGRLDHTKFLAETTKEVPSSK